MRILCPLCGFGREVDLAKIPPRAQMATCPRCEHKFRFRVVDDLPPAGPTTPGAPVGDPRLAPPSPPRGGQDPMAAQRAAAELAWKHLQGVKPEVLKPDAPKVDVPRADVPGPDAPSPDPALPDATATGAANSEATKSDASGVSDASGASGASGAAGTPPGGQQPAAPTYLNAPQAPGRSAPSFGQPSEASPVPFEDLPRHGFFPGLWRTITEVLKTPTAFFSAMPVTGGMSKPLIFHLLLAEFMVLSQFFWGLTGLGALSQYSGSQELMDLGLGLSTTSPIFILVLYPLLLILRLMLMTGVIHFLLRAIFRFTGGQGSGAEATFRVLCYAAAPLILGVVPFFGPLLGGVWSIGLTIIGLKAAHRTSGSSAAFAVMLPILLLLAAALGLMQAGLQG